MSSLRLVAAITLKLLEIAGLVPTLSQNTIAADAAEAPHSNSFFLFGARGTGKTTSLQTWMRELLCPSNGILYLDLLDPDLESELSVRPAALQERVVGAGKQIQWVVIDECQKVPKILDVVHSLIESKKLKFALTGSSARKLKRGGANLLAGRAFEFHLHPLTAAELGKQFDLLDAIMWGILPKIFDLDSNQNKKRFLKAYTHMYLREEIIAEQIVRNIDRFRHFLPVAAQSNGTILNFSEIARQSGVDEKSVAHFFEILVDTLIGFYLEPFHRSVRKRQYQKPKFYFFDSGVTRAMAQQLDQNIVAGTSLYGHCFEHFFILELMRQIEYQEREIKLSYLESSQGVEVDLIIEKSASEIILLEIKSSESVIEDHWRNLELIASDFPASRRIVAYRGNVRRQVGNGIDVLPWQAAIEEILG